MSKYLFLLLAAMLTACGPTLQVSADYDGQVDFSKFKTFSFYRFTDQGPGVSELNRNRIIAAVKKQMVAKGFVFDENNPDVLVNATTILKEQQQVTGTTNYYGYGGYYRPYGWGPGYTGTTTYNVNNYYDGSLIIDVIEFSTKTLVWQGTGNQKIDGPLKHPDEEINFAVKKIMAGFPPKPSMWSHQALKSTQLFAIRSQ